MWPGQVHVSVVQVLIVVNAGLQEHKIYLHIHAHSHNTRVSITSVTQPSSLKEFVPDSVPYRNTILIWWMVRSCGVPSLGRGSSHVISINDFQVVARSWWGQDDLVGELAIGGGGWCSSSLGHVLAIHCFCRLK